MVHVYLHIPFCQRKCLYCDFYSVEDTAHVDAFLSALSREIRLVRAGHGDEVVFTIYFGGGTPSLLSAERVGGVLDELRRHWQIREDAEITLEANPGTLTAPGLRALRSMGINRISLGIQSFQDPLLRFLGRIHSRADALRAVEMAHAAGFDNLSLDLIYGIPDESLGQWEEDLRTAVALAPTHVSAYNLTIARHTPLGKMAAAGAVRPAATDHEAAMFERADAALCGAGFEHYEVSNYARPGFRCRHNCAYWSRNDYLGLGPSAHSLRKDRDGACARRWRNVPDLSTYADRLARGLLPIEFEERVAGRELAQERILLGLRSTGLDLARLHADLGYALDGRHHQALVQWMLEERLGILEGPLLRLTAKGYLLCDEICARLCRDLAGP